jgi:thymidylate synthase
VEIIRELITRPQYPAPKVTLNPDVKDFYQFTTDDIKVENYQHCEQVRNIPVAI